MTRRAVIYARYSSDKQSENSIEDQIRVCKEHIEEVKDFLSKFFEEERGRYNHPGWVTFKVPNSDFLVNLMRGKDQPMTQNMTFEIYLDSKEELENYAKKHGVEVKSFLATETESKYRYHYVEFFGPENICKVEVNYSEDKKEDN